MAAEIYITIRTGSGLELFPLLHYGRELNARDQVIDIMIVIMLFAPPRQTPLVLAPAAIPARPLRHECPSILRRNVCTGSNTAFKHSRVEVRLPCTSRS